MKILVIDDHAIVLDGVAALLASIEPNAYILTARDAKTGYALVETHPDIEIVLLDLKMPGVSGFSALAELARLRPALPIIVLSSSEEPADVRKAIGSGALGYVPKSASRHTLLSAITMVMNGELFVPSLMVGEHEAPPGAVSTANGASPRLTDRQVEVLRMLSQGFANKVIAQRLDLSEKTVKIHISSIFKALGVINRTQAASVGRELGFI